jgi:predicted FMN-binding regulatory protein PaiB
VRNLCSLAEQCGHNDQLSADDQRIEKLIPFILGFEIEIEEMIGRFKLSQDRSESDRHSAAAALARKTDLRELGIIEYVVGLPLLLGVDAVANLR